MPKLYEYFGLIVLFYANEHEPVHVHGKCQGRELRAELIVLNGVVTEIRYAAVTGRAPLESNDMRFFEEVVSARANDIVAKWIDFFVMHKPIKAENINPEAQMTAKIINIVSAKPAGDLCLHLSFDDGNEQIVDFKPFLSRSVHPDIRAYLDPERFAAFRIEYGELVWGDYDLCFPVIDLYRNQLEKSAALEAAA